MKVLAYLLYGQKAEYELELTLSILSALRHLGPDAADVTIAVVTDRTSFLPGFPIEIMTVPADELKRWQTTERGTYYHRAKPFALLRALDHYQAPTALIDTDTYFVADPRLLFERISMDTSLMHASDNYRIGENKLWDPITPSICEGVEVEGVPVSPETEMLNSGVIGIPPGNRPLIEKSIVLLDYLYAIGPVFNVEQLAIGAVLAKYTTVATCQDVLLHYWGSGYRKPFIHLAVSRFMATHALESAGQIAQASSSVLPEFPRSSKVDVAIAKFLGKLRHWDGSYQFAYLSQRTAFSKSKSDPELATLWANCALTSLQNSLESGGTSDLSGLRRDFKTLGPGSLDKLAWLAPASKNAWQAFWNQHP